MATPDQRPDPPSADGESSVATSADTDAVGLAVDTASAAAVVISVPAAPNKKRRIGFWLAVGWLVAVVVGAILADVLPLRDPNAQTIVNRLSKPGQNGYLLGADPNGRDILARLIFGARVSLIVSVTAVTVGSVVGGALGLTAGFFRGWYERLVMSAVDVVLAFPALVLLLALVAFMGQSLRIISGVIGFLAIPTYARVARATTLTISQREYVLAARAMGAKSTRILIKELLPNVMLPVLAFGLVALGLVIVAEGSLAFLGLSVQFPTPTWGAMIAEGKIHLRRAPHISLIPSMAMLLTVLSINYVGDSLRSRFDVRESSL
ncbi:MAG: ABC transporter permease [Acidimicrobiales bacterium]